MPDPVFLTLEEWGGRVNTIGRNMTLPAGDLWVHHSVTNEDIGVWPTEDAVSDFLELDREGVAGGISYSYAIHPNGIIGEGQGTRQGAHTGGTLGCNFSPWGWNPCSFGVCFIGDFHPRWIGEGDDAVWFPGDQLSDKAVNSFRWLRDKLITDGLLVPGVYPTGGHRDASGNSTACPGDNIETRLDELRAPYAIEEDEAPMYVVYSIRNAAGIEVAIGSAVGPLLRHGNDPVVKVDGSARDHDAYAVVSEDDWNAAWATQVGAGPLTIGLKVIE